MSLRVAHVLNSPGLGGVPRAVHGLVSHCDPAEIAPLLFYLKPGPGPDLFDSLDLPRHAATAASKSAAMIQLVAWLDRHRVDILHTHSFRPNLYGRMAGAVLRPAGLRILAQYHNQYDDKWQADTLTLERRLARHTDAAVAVSTAVAAHVTCHTGLVPEVILNGVDRTRVLGGNRSAGRTALGLRPEAPVAGLVGRICHQKGVDTFVEAAIRVARDLPQAQFVIAGDPEDRPLTDRLRQRARTAGLADTLRFAGHRAEMADLLAALDVLAAPSRWEGFGLGVAEAMTAGLPVVASSVGGLPEVLGTAGRLVPPDDPAALAEVLLDLLRSPRARASLGAAGRSAATRFDWSAAAARLTTLYKRLGAAR